jgi:hypothetical protein
MLNRLIFHLDSIFGLINFASGLSEDFPDLAVFDRSKRKRTDDLNIS